MCGAGKQPTQSLCSPRRERGMSFTPAPPMPQLQNWDISMGDRGDAVAVALRRFWLRIESCRCQHVMAEPCVQCKHDTDTLMAAWRDTEPAHPGREGREELR